MLLLNLAAVSARAEDGRIFKVLPQFLDTNGAVALTPSLYDRDAYQKILRLNPAKRSTLRFAVEWNVKNPDTKPLKLRLELRGTAQANAPRESSMELPLRQHHYWFSHWDYIVLKKDEYKKFGDVTAWRVTMWDGDQLLGEQKSFLW
jgi:hypothetical protein